MGLLRVLRRRLPDAAGRLDLAPDSRLAVAGATPGHMEPDAVSYTVGYSDLNLGTEKGRKELADRIQVAAAYVCKKMDEPTGQCRSFATGDAVVAARAADHQMRAPGWPWIPLPPG